MVEWVGFKTLDEAWGQVKGTAFRCFKRVEPRLVDNEDYRVLGVVEDAVEIAGLKAAGGVYASSVQVVLVNAGVVARLREQLAA